MAAAFRRATQKFAIARRRARRSRLNPKVTPAKAHCDIRRLGHSRSEGTAMPTIRGRGRGEGRNDEIRADPGGRLPGHPMASGGGEGTRNDGRLPGATGSNSARSRRRAEIRRRSATTYAKAARDRHRPYRRRPEWRTHRAGPLRLEATLLPDHLDTPLYGTWRDDRSRDC